MNITALYETVTNDIIAELETGVAPWVKPWKTICTPGMNLLPANAVTGHTYSGINIPILWHQACVRGYSTHAWLTFKQARSKGAAVRKGERGTTVVFTKKLRIEDKETDEEKTFSMLKTFVVFNVAQVDGLPHSTDIVPHDRPETLAQRFIDATGARIHHGGDRACFIPSMDCINLPPRAAFRAEENYLATALHELGHWAGHTTRLNRDLSGRFGTRWYAAEELVAELSAAFLCAHLGITGELRHAGYIAIWIELLKHDHKAIFTAASKASQAADYLRSFSEPVTAG